MAVTNPYYEFTPEFIPGTKARSEEVNIQYQAIQNAFDLLPGSADAITTGTATFAPESGSGNAYVITMPDTRTSNQDGDHIVFFATHSNTGAATIDVDGIGAVALVDWDGTALIGGEIVNGRLYNVRYDATNTRFVLEASADAALQKVYAKEWANNPVGTLVSAAAGGDQVDDYSALHQATAAEAWAIRAEDDPVPTVLGGDGLTTFSAYHWAQKASGASGVPIGTVTNSVMRYETGTGWVEETDFRINTSGAILQVDADAAAIETFAFPAVVPGGTPVTDPNIGSVELLITAENAPATATTFASDIGPSFEAVTAGAGVAEITTSAAKFGTKAVYVEDYTSTNAAYWRATSSDAGLTFGANDFTIEMHVYVPSIVAFSGTVNFMGVYDSGDAAWAMTVSFQTASDFRHSFLMSSDGTNNNFSSPQKLWGAGTAGTWYHLAVCRSGNNLRHFIDGVQVGTTDDVTGFTMFTPTTAVMYIGEYRDAPTTGGPAQTILWDNIRITAGVARYTAGFTPPAGPYDGSDALNTLYVGDPSYDTQIDGSNIAIAGPTTISDTLEVTGATALANTQIRAGLTDAVTRTLEYAYTDGTVRAATGHFAGSDFEIQNQINGANVVIKANDAGGTPQTLGTFDPDALSLVVGPFTMSSSFLGATNSGRARILPEATTATNPGIIPRGDDLDTGIGWRSADVLTLVAGGEARFEALATGVTRVISPGTLGTDPANLQFVTSGVASKGHVGFFSSGELELRNSQISNLVVIQGTNAGSTLNTMGRFDPDGECSLWYNGLPRTGTNSNGRLNVYSDGNTDAEQRTVNFAHLDGTVRSSIGNVTGTEFILRNLIHGGPVQITAEDDAGVTRTILDADPDSTTTVRADTSLIFQVAASETAIIANDNSSVDLYYDNQLRFSTLTSGSAQILRGSTTDTDQCRLGFANSNGVDRAWVGFGIQGNSRVELNSEVHGGALYITGETAGGVAQNLFSGSPGANDTIIYSNGVSELVVGTSKIPVNALFMNQRSGAAADTADDGQLWVLNDSPNILMFTDDTGQDYAVAMNGGYVNDNVNVNNSWNFNTSGNRSANFISYHGDGGNDTITLGNSTGTGLTNFPIYDSITIIAPGSGNITISEGTGTTLYDETGTDTVGGVVLSGGVVTIFRASATDYILWGNGWT